MNFAHCARVTVTHLENHETNGTNFYLCSRIKIDTVAVAVIIASSSFPAYGSDHPWGQSSRAAFVVGGGWPRR